MFDWLGQNHEDLKQYYSDGFQLEDSSFYGIANCKINSDKKVYETHRIKLKFFTDKFDKSLSLFKLHGSIDNIIPNTNESDNQIVRIKTNYSVTRYQREDIDPNTGDNNFKELMEDVKPDFLSGTTNKKRFYNSDPYYEKLFEHFKNNLLSSELLVVIGYGFKDERINDYLKNYFLKDNKPIFIIDPFIPDTISLKYKPFHIQKSVTEVTYQEYVEQILSKL